MSISEIWAEAIRHAEQVALEDIHLRVIGRADRLHEKLRATSGSAHRRSKRLEDLADVQALLESTPTLAQELRAEERDLLDQLPR